MHDSFPLAERAAVSTRKLRSLSDSTCQGVWSDVELTIRDKAGNLKHHAIQHNLRTNAGADFWNSQLFSLSAAGTQANWMALTTDATAPAVTDTTLTSEETLNGLARAQAAVAHTAGTTQSVLSKTFTYTGSTTKTIAKLGLFTASSAGTMALETLLSSTGTVNANGDQITIQWTVNY